MKICKFCGASVAEGNKFCHACGNPISNSKEKNHIIRRSGRIPKAAIILIAAIAILCIVISVSLTSAKEAKVKSNINLGNKYLSEGKYEEAILAFEKVISIDKKNVDARLMLTEAYLKTDRFKDANRVCMEILDINPSDKEAYIKLAEVMIAEGRTDDAVSYLKKVFEKNGDSLVKKKLEELIAAQPLTNITDSILQDSNYNLPDKIKLNINNSEEEHSVKWTNQSVDTKTPGTYTFEGSIEEYDRKITLTLEVKPKDLFLISGAEVSMDKKQKEDMDQFFSIFSSLFVNPFENSSISDDEQIMFGLLYIDHYEWDSKVMKIPNTSKGNILASDIDEVCMNYFGKKPSAHKTVDRYSYSDGKYTYEFASGEAFIGSKTDHLFDLGNNFYRADISTYIESDSEYTEPGNKMSAIIKKVTENSTERYILISYRLKGSNTGAANTTPTVVAASFNTWKADASSLLAENTGSHPASYAYDEDFNTAWVEGVKDDGIGEWIKLSGTDQQTLSGLRIINGYSKNSDLYQKNNRVKKIRIELSDGSVFEKEVSDGNMDFQTINLDRQIKTDFVKITILEVYRGSKYRDTCISEIELF